MEIYCCEQSLHPWTLTGHTKLGYMVTYPHFHTCACANLELSRPREGKWDAQTMHLPTFAISARNVAKNVL